MNTTLRRRLLAILLLLTTATMSAVASSSQASTGSAFIHLSPSASSPDTPVTVTGGGFRAGETVNILFDRQTWGSTTADRTGAIQATLFVPLSASPGNHTVKAIGAISRITASATCLVRTDWPQVGYDAAHTSFNSKENTLGTANVASLQLKWSFYLGSPTTSPVIAGGLAYEGSPGRVTAVDVATGSWKWTVGIKNDLVPGLASYGNVLFVASPDGSLFALNQDDGSHLWNIPATCDPDWVSAAYAPAVENGIVVVVGQGSCADRVTAYDVTNGTVEWTYQSAPGCVLDGRPAIGSKTVYVVYGWWGCSHPELLALDTSTGTVQWQADLDPAYDLMADAPVVDAQHVYVARFKVVGEGSLVNAFPVSCATPCQPVWTTNEPYGVWAAPTLANGLLYLTDVGGGLTARDASSGAYVWGALVTNLGVESSPSVAGDVVYVGDDQGGVTAFAANCQGTCWDIWATAPPGSDPILTAPAVSDGVLYLTKSGNLLAYGLP